MADNIRSCIWHNTSVRRISQPAQAVLSAAMNIEEVIKLARLARLKVGDGEVEGLGRDLSAILALVKRLESASLDDVEPLAHPLDAVQRLRADEVTEDDRRDAFQKIAPHTRDGFYLVPKVID